jgi:glycosyltransferase involved in cell wall biosynthesis
MSGYGVQCAHTARALRELGHEVAISAYAGCHEEREWDGIPVLSCGGKSYGNGVIAGQYERWRADLLILFTDLFVIDPGQMNGLSVMPHVPVDCDPLGVMDKRWLDQVNKIALLNPVAMSEHGRAKLGEAGYDAPVVPHATDFRPRPELRAAWRQEMNLPDDVFVAAKVGVNNRDDRKAFVATVHAFAAFVRKHPRSALYLHTEAQAKDSPNLAYMAKVLGISNRVAFADEYKRAADLYPAAWMEAMYNGVDVLDATSKGEGFGVPAIEALACGTPVIGSRNSAMPEKIRPAWGWLVGGQPDWPTHHQAAWQIPSVTQLARAYEAAFAGARGMRAAAARAGERWSVDAMTAAWKMALDRL